MEVEDETIDDSLFRERGFTCTFYRGPFLGQVHPKTSRVGIVPFFLTTEKAHFVAQAKIVSMGRKRKRERCRETPLSPSSTAAATCRSVSNRVVVCEDECERGTERMATRSGSSGKIKLGRPEKSVRPPPPSLFAPSSPRARCASFSRGRYARWRKNE